MNPLRAVGQVLHWEPRHGIGPTFLGTCFAFGSDGTFVTASHCVGDLEAEQLGIMAPLGGLTKTALSVARHPTADIAVVRTAIMNLAGNEVEPFELIVDNHALGEEFFAFGFPADVLGPEVAKPTERLFKGHYQRFFEFRSHAADYRYLAAELSIAAPAGLSGGPLFRPGAPEVVVGMATENLRSTTVLEVTKTVTTGGETIDTRETRVIEYGVALMLSGVRAWLNNPDSTV